MIFVFVPERVVSGEVGGADRVPELGSLIDLHLVMPPGHLVGITGVSYRMRMEHKHKE